MTDAQWLFEYEALRKREEEQADIVGTVLKTVNEGLVRLLGLDLLREKPDDGWFMPLALMVARREVVERIMKKFQDNQAFESAKMAAESDEVFEQMSLAMAKGDMEPLTQDDLDRLFRAKQRAREDELARVGVKVVEHRPNSAPHVNIEGRQGQTPPNVKVEFDDNG